MKKIIYFCTLLVFAVSCSSDDADQTPTPTPPVGILLKKTIQTTAFDTYTNIFTYNGNKLIAITGSSFIIKHFYTGNLITKIEYRNVSGSLQGTNNLTYDASQRLTVLTRTNEGIDQGFRSTYQYNADGTITVKEYSRNEGESEELDDTKVYIYGSNNEIETIKTYNVAGILTRTTSLVYDTKFNPFHNITGYSKLMTIDPANVFNLVSTTTTGSNPGSQTNTYEYNNDDLATLRTIYSNGVLDSSTQYIYQ